MVAIGANLPSRAGSAVDSVHVALGLLASGATRLLAQSRLYRTPAYPPGAGPDYVNAVVKVATALDSAALLGHLHAVEARLGRTRKKRWESRVLDLDLLSFGGAILPDLDTYRQWRDLAPARQGTEMPTGLILPHPRLHERGFVLVPLNDIAPDWRHPVTGQSARDMLAALDPSGLVGISPIAE